MYPMLVGPISFPFLLGIAAAGGAITTVMSMGLRPIIRNLPQLSIPFNLTLIPFLAISQIIPKLKTTNSIESSSSDSASFSSLSNLSQTFSDLLNHSQIILDDLAGLAEMAFGDKPITGALMLSAIFLSYLPKMKMVIYNFF